MIESPIRTQPHVSVVLLNWNGWRDTVECLESVFRLEYPRFTVIVCDNASADGSPDRIKEWANGELSASCMHPRLSLPLLHAVPKPIAWKSLQREDALNPATSPAAPLVLIQNGANLGFAGGNNVGIRYALARRDCDYVWVLNNDTVVEPDALSAMVRMAERDPKLGVCGSLLRSYAPPYDILTAGGRRYIRWSGRTRPLPDSATPRLSTNRGAPAYIEGASMLIRRSCLEQAGLLDEDYFLYFEEIDYVSRAGPAFHFGYTPESVVYHKEGASIGSAAKQVNRSARSEFYLARSRLMFTRRYHPWFLASVAAVVGVSALQRIVLGRPRNAAAIVRGAFASFRRGTAL